MGSNLFGRVIERILPGALKSFQGPEEFKKGGDEKIYILYPTGHSDGQGHPVEGHDQSVKRKILALPLRRLFLNILLLRRRAEFFC